MAPECRAASRPPARPCLYSPVVNAEFNWWLLIVGLVIGAGLVWLILADWSRREADVTARERASEARWIAEELRRAGRRVDDEAVADVLDLHALYLAAPPPDDPDEDVDPGLARFDGASRRTEPRTAEPDGYDGASFPPRRSLDGPAAIDGAPAD